ncbi:CRISPR-associated helicase Cas3' [Phragmitibacter flavus]|uniref:CRISPR-associated helicase Cas3 n=1 Tax=Phragmitibacter flavus TaxID=2576071 RepID=A0A5R8K910_9BACT|nr:CRISPR-associated helicase Cas3' [Phragmitibacter flavus]TLD68814.1 CRISPR-associated helicase Cas3' [Phragmitibacter flavus]
MPSDFANFFEKATGNPPYDYQCRVAELDCESRLISIPTGLGKTAAVILAWLWNRVHNKSDKWPRRLVYCLPMRTLVEQTRDEAEKWIAKLVEADLAQGAPPQVHILMGGEDKSDWDLYPEKPAILIGTQDMLLSRALNRGYGMARARWPMHFGLINNDALWIIDEMQLMGAGLATTAQLQAFRPSGTNTHTWWMSATLQPSWLDTPDTQNLLAELPPIITTSAPTGISKPLTLAPPMDERGIASLIADSHPPRITLVVLNTVNRAHAVYEALLKNKAFVSVADIHLAHSRFRPAERAAWRARFLSRDAAIEKPRVIIATQVVEAGVDISSDKLITELAPWTSLVQRFGRAARYGGTASITVIDIADEKKAAPYDFSALEAARSELKQLTDVSIESLVVREQSLTPERRAVLYPYSPDFLLLPHEIDELFDTTADLSGADLDISRYIRSSSDTDCQIAWIAEKPAPEYAPSTLELCSVPIGDAKKFAETRKNAVWRWDYLDGEWKTAGRDNIFPGITLIALATAGGYSENTGFDLSSKNTVLVVPRQIPPIESPDSRQDSDALSVSASFQTIKEHGEEVLAELQKIGLELSPALEHAALWHDLGKAHPAFQSIIRDNPGKDTAKAPPGHWLKTYRISDNDLRPGFRHELASALALLMLRQSLPVQFTDEDFNLLLYVVVAHHGKVRARLASAPVDQEHPVAKAGGEMPIRGIMKNDVVPGAAFGLPDATLSLDPAAIGFSPKTGAAWTERVIGLLETFGAFRLAYLETLLRAADCRASQPK